MGLKSVVVELFSTAVMGRLRDRSKAVVGQLYSTVVMRPYLFTERGEFHITAVGA